MIETTMMTQPDLAARFQQEFGATPHMFRAPGRVNLIGEHTDYNQGWVLPCAIDHYVWAAFSPRPDRKLSLRSVEFENLYEFDLDHLPSSKLSGWCDYVLGVALQLQAAGVALKGTNLLIHSDLPVGAGLSSSAALEVAGALTLLSVAGAGLPVQSLPQLCQRAENEFVGAHIGIMDPFVSCFGREQHAALLDCRSLQYQLVPIPDRIRLVICNTKVRHELSGGEYNRRRQECEQAVNLLNKTYPAVHSLRDASLEQLARVAERTSPLLFRRGRHVITENERVLRAAEAFRAGDLSQIGLFMQESHRSLRDDYEASCRELDLMVKSAQGLPGVYGARMTGGGFGGCTVNLVEANHAQEFASEIAHRYREKAGIAPDVFVCSPADGAAAILENA